MQRRTQPSPVSLGVVAQCAQCSGDGPLNHRRYRAYISDAKLTPTELISEFRHSPNSFSPTAFAVFDPPPDSRGMLVGDEITIRLPGPWNGPIVVTDVEPQSLRFETRHGHMEAGWIRFSSFATNSETIFEIESIAGRAILRSRRSTTPARSHVKIYEQTDTPIDMVLAVSGPSSLDLARDTGCVGIMATDPDAELVDGWADRGGDRNQTWTEVPIAWEPTVDKGRETARRFRFGMQGWDVAAELPNPAHFEAATQFLTDDQISEAIPNGPDPAPYVKAIEAFVEAGFSRIALVPVGDDIVGTLDFWENEIKPRLAP